MGRSLDVSRHFATGDPVSYVKGVDELREINTDGLKDGQVAEVAGTLFKQKMGEWEPTTTINAVSYGASPDASPSDNYAAIMQALEDAAGKTKVYLPAGEYIVNDTIELPSNTYVYGDGSSTVIKMEGSIRRGELLMLTGHRGNHKENIVIENMTLDSNRERWSVSGGSSKYSEALSGAGTSNRDRNPNVTQSTLMICNSSNVLVRNVKALDGWKHCIDISAPWYGRGESSALEYDEEPSTYIKLENCTAIGAGDDCITSHQCSFVWIDGCTAAYPSGIRTSNNCNCVEIDDASRNVWMTNTLVIGGVRGVEVKGHSDSPAPYNVFIDGLKAINNCRGVELRHLGHHSSPGDTSGDTGDPEDDAELGLSATARNVSLSNIEVVAPRRLTSDDNPIIASYNDVSRFGIMVKAYTNVQMTNVRITDGAEDLESKDYLPSLPGDISTVFRFYLNARRGIVKNLEISGFNESSHGVYTSGSMEDGLSVDGLVITNGPRTGFRATSPTNNIFLDNYDITGDHIGEDTHGVRLSGGTGIGNNKKFLGKGIVSGYDRPVAWNGITQTENTVGFPGRLIFLGNAGNVNNPTAGLHLGQSELFPSQGEPYLYVGSSRVDTDTQSFSVFYGTGNTTPITTRVNNDNSRDAIVFEDPEGVVGKIRTGNSVALWVEGGNGERPLVVSFGSNEVRPSDGDDDNKYKLGASNARWSEVYAANGTINTSDAREKQQVRDLNSTEKEVAAQLKGMIRAFKWNHAVEKKGDDARWHFGAMAQEVADVFDTYGLDAHDYGLFCYDYWDEQPEEIDDETGEVNKEYRPAGDRYGVRYDQLLAFIISAM